MVFLFLYYKTDSKTKAFANKQLPPPPPKKKKKKKKKISNSLLQTLVSLLSPPPKKKKKKKKKFLLMYNFFSLLGSKHHGVHELEPFVADMDLNLCPLSPSCLRGSSLTSHQISNNYPIPFCYNFARYCLHQCEPCGWQG